MKSLQQHIIRLALSLIVLLNIAPPTAAQTQQPPPDPRFGAVEAYMAPQLAADLRVGWDRMIIHWYDRQPDKLDQWNVSGAEIDRIATAETAGREIVALLMGTPPWATDGTPIGGVPRGLYLPVSDPGNLWATFVRRAVGEYKGRINRWIIWNEPDIAMTDPGAQFEGTVQDYYQLLKVAYLAAKEVNPKAVIHLAGLTYWHDVVYNRPSYLKRLLDVARQDKTARANNYYFDVFTAHIYFRSETVYEIIASYRKLLRQYGLRQPIWLNETNAAPTDDPQYPASPLVLVTMDQQAAFIIQANALALAAGADRIAIYKFYDETAPPPGGESYGLFRPDGSARPAAEAYRLVTTHFAKIQQVTDNSAATYHLITLKRDKAMTRVAWARRGQSVTLQLRATPKMTHVALYDHLGKAYPVAADKKGVFTLTLPPATCNATNDCPVGGSPWILVETP